MGARRTGEPARRDASHGTEHLRGVHRHGAPPARPRAGVSLARPLRRDALHRRAPADAARPRRAQPHDGGAVRPRRAVHRSAPVEHRRAHGRDARPASPTETPSSSSTTTRRFCGKQTGSSRWARRRARRGGHVIAEGPVAAIAEDPASQIGPFLSRGAAGADIRRRAAREELFAGGEIRLSTGGIHTVKPLEVDTPEGSAHGCDGRLRLGQDDDGAREPRPRAAGADHRRAPSPPTSRRSDAEGIAPRQAHRRDAHRAERPLDCRNLRERPRRAAQALRPLPRSEGARPEGGRLLVQHRHSALPRLRRDGRGES